MKNDVTRYSMLRGVTNAASASASASVLALPGKEECTVGTRKRAPRPLEKHVQAAIIQAFKLKHRIKLWTIDAGCAGMRLGSLKGQKGHSGIPEGFPDLLGVIHSSGRALFIEVKRPGCKPRTNQMDFLAWLASMGAVAFWADSVDSAMVQFDEAMRRAA